jgi:6-phosphogluconolactonase
MQIEVVASGSQLDARAADHLECAVRAALASRGTAVLALSGGSHTDGMFRDLAGRDLPWVRVVIVQVDERVAPDGDPDRNANAITAAFGGQAQLHLMPVTARDLEAAAARYSELLQAVCGGVIDVVHLGIGLDGHTASLIPGDPVLQEHDRDVAVTGEFQGRRRMTMTYPILNRARQIVWRVGGAAKRDAVEALVSSGPVPAAGVSQRNAVLVATRDAVGEATPAP